LGKLDAQAFVLKRYKKRKRMIIFMDVELRELQTENRKFEAIDSDKRIIIKGIAAMNKYLGYSDEVWKNVVLFSPNQSLIYRHIHPASPAEGVILGNMLTVKDVLLKDSEGKDIRGLEYEALMMNNTLYQQKAVEYVKRKQLESPIGVSIGVQEYKNKDLILDARPYEFSLTHIPVCEECLNTEVISMVDKKEQTTDELKLALDEAVKKNADLEVKLRGFEQSEKKLEDKIKEVAEGISKKYETEITNVMKLLEDSRKKLEQAEKQPIIDELVKLEGDEELTKEFYPSRSKIQLTERLIKLKKTKAPAIVTKTLEQSRIDALGAEDTIKQMEEFRKKRAEFFKAEGVPL
jgi:hypothetical protein